MPEKRLSALRNNLDLSEFHIRPMTSFDMGKVVETLNQSFPDEWTAKSFREFVKDNDCTVEVAQYDQKVVGVLAYEILRFVVRVHIVAVMYWVRRKGIGSFLLERAARVARKSRKLCYRVYVREKNEDALNFFKSQKPTTCALVRDHFADTKEDGIVMEYKV